MKSIVNPQLVGKWYKHTRNPRSRELKFMEIFIYLSAKAKGQILKVKDSFDLLYVGIKEDRNKVLRKMSLRTISRNSCNYLVVRGFLFRKKFKVLSFDESNGLLILSDRRMKNISIYSRKHKISNDIIEKHLRLIHFKNPIDITLEDK